MSHLVSGKTNPGFGQKRYTVVARIWSGEERCPVCGESFRADALARRRCWDCSSFLAFPGEGLLQLQQIREPRPDCPTFEISLIHAHKDIYFWERPSPPSPDAITIQLED